MHEEITKELEHSTGILLRSLAELSESQLKYKISPQIWSVHEFMEHIVITEIGVFRILVQQNGERISSSGATEKIGKEKLERILSNRAVKTEAPDDVKPIGRFSSMNELLDKFVSNRKRIIDALKDNSIVFDSRIIPHPVLGEMTKMDWLHFLIHHSERHFKQIEEIKSMVRSQ